MSTTMKPSKAMTYLKDYTVPAYLIPKTELHIALFESKTIVTSTLSIIKNPKSKSSEPLTLNGLGLKTLSIKCDDVECEEKDVFISTNKLILETDKSAFTLQITTEITPSENTELEGLYQSGGSFCTQCEPEGFRRITWYIDRPDNMSVFTTTIQGDRKNYPHLLSNGNPSGYKLLDDNRHEMTWHDPFPKPCYLFALVAGKFDVLEDQIISMTGRSIALKIYTEPGKKDRAVFAMEALKKSIAWDEVNYGREYDLDLFMIVAVRDFNMGAMENKGLNIFNDAYILADPKTATDSDYHNIERVIAHEYFHNWTGNRITCRDWFQLTLKEGLTVFRDQQFTHDVQAGVVQRIEDVKSLKNFQFIEDSGPLAHPIRPAFYKEVNNFYTATVYEKGAEIIRMIYMFLGPEKFRKGMNHYFDTYDGQAVTTEDFIASMEIGGEANFKQFQEWYHQAGTPQCTVSCLYDENNQTLTLTVKQSCQPTPESRDKKPFYFPLCVGFLNKEGQEMTPTAPDKIERRGTTYLIPISKQEDFFTFGNITEKPVLSLLRDFSAPVNLIYKEPASHKQLRFKADPNLFNRYEAGQQLILDQINQAIEAKKSGATWIFSEELCKAIGGIVTEEKLNPRFVAEAITIPSLSTVLSQRSDYPVKDAFDIRERLLHQIAEKNSGRFQERYDDLRKKQAQCDFENQMPLKVLKNVLLRYLGTQKAGINLAKQQFETADNLTDELAALSILVNQQSGPDHAALNSFYEKWKHEHLIVNKWLALQAGAKFGAVLDNVKELESHPAFSIKNPNSVRALLGAFSRNLPHFLNPDGSGIHYLMKKIIELDSLNSLVSSRLLQAFKEFNRYDEEQSIATKSAFMLLMNQSKRSNAVNDVMERMGLI